LFEVHCEEEDFGLIIGTQGANITAVRTLVGGACRGAQVRTQVEVCHSRP